MKNLLLPLLFVLASCSSTMVIKPGAPSEYAPKNYQSVGQIKYLNNGADFIIGKRREDAFKQMHKACNGDYEITSEGNRPSGKTISPNGFGGLSVNDSSQYVYIDFKCGGRAPASN